MTTRETNRTQRTSYVDGTRVCRNCRTVLRPGDGLENNDASAPLQVVECPGCGAVLSIGSHTDW